MTSEEVIAIQSMLMTSECYIIFFYQLTAILVIALLTTIAEAVSDNRELTRVFHHTISSDLKVIVPASFYCIRTSRYFQSS